MLNLKRICLGVFLLLVILLERTCFGYSPVNMAIVAGQPVTMSCGIPSSDGLIWWKFQQIGSHEAAFIFNGYNISKDRPKFSISFSKEGWFDIANNDSQLQNAGSYQCIQTILEPYRQKTGIAHLTVLSSASNCGSNANNGALVENENIRIWCKVDYLGDLDPVMEWSRDDGRMIDSTLSYNKTSYPFNLTSTASEMMESNDHNVTYICKTYFKTPAMVPEKNDIFTASNAPDYTAECNLTISVLHGPRNLSITPRKKTYAKGDRIICSAYGNPTPTYSWRDIDTGHVVNGQYLTLDGTMEKRKSNTFQCIAENTIAEEKKTTNETITFNVAATILDASPDKSSNVIVGTGSAIGGIAITVVAVILWRLLERKCHNQPKETKSAEKCDSPHDYESVNSGDSGSNQHTPDIEMDQSSTMANQTVDPSIAAAEEDLEVAETLNHYDMLDGGGTVQEPRPYSTLETPNPEDEVNHATESSHSYYNVEMNNVVSEQDALSN